MASGVELDLLRRVQALEQQVQQLSTTQRDETLQPTYLTINPATGAVGALFAGGLQMPEGSSSVYVPNQSLSWSDALGIVREFISGYLVASSHVLLMVSQADAQDVAQLEIASGGGSSQILAQAQSPTTFEQVTLLDSLGRSSFLQIGSVILSTAGTTTITFPGGTYEASVNVFLPGASGTVYGVATATGRSDGGGLVMTALTPLGSGLVTFTVLAANQPANGVTVGVSYIIWGS